MFPPSATDESGVTKLDRFAFEAAVVADAGGWASSAESAAVVADPLSWAATLRRLIHETDDGLRGTRPA